MKPPSTALVEYLAQNYAEFVALTPYLDKAVAYDLCQRIWLRIYEKSYSEAKAA